MCYIGRKQHKFGVSFTITPLDCENHQKPAVLRLDLYHLWYRYFLLMNQRIQRLPACQVWHLL